MNQWTKIGIIPARLNSSRFPEKLLRKVDERTLLQITYENAKKCQYLDEVFIATDSEKIATAAKKFHARVILTPECASGTERIAKAIEKEKQFGHVKYVVCIQGDHPCIAPSTIESIIKNLEISPDTFICTAALKITNETAVHSPHIVKCVIDRFSNALYFSRASIPYSKGENKSLYQHLGVYGFRKEFLLVYPALSQTPLQSQEDLEQLKMLEHGYKIKVAVVEDSPLAVDVAEDLEKLKQLLC